MIVTTVPRALPVLAAALLTLGLGLTPCSAVALQSDAAQPMLIEADRVEVDEGKSTSLYLGQVQVDQGTMRLLADQVTVHHRSDRQIKYIIARGEPASYKQQLDGEQGEMQAFAKRMDYDADRDELILTGEALVIQGTDRIASERIVYDRAHARVQAGGDSRVKIQMTPQAKKDGKPPAPGTAAAPPAPPVPAPKAPPPGRQGGA
ncbi:lipopolysaccharide transport periplasmic protein LptA [uncultured Thiodictyon sp.]|uniref:lipopolysaccharide transport periplasmic protein LptA n=1 Tax=uncultured Thiodictyon sp. TaxID=1846217 RepID=UPI0025E8A752|nr:lipopolysaccharide transport periplasmic protein LptA [uncultured Thiodictyon sp.]